MTRVAEDQRIILQMAGAGISVTLYGIKLGSGKWRFSLDKNEAVMADFLSKEDDDLLPTLHSKSGYVNTWAEAVSLLDRYPWTMFVPEHVHPEFLDLVRSAVQTRKPTRPVELKRPLYKAWEHFLRCDTAAKDEGECGRSELN